MSLSVSGFDKLQRELEDVQSALASLDSTIATLRFDPSSAASVQKAIQQMAPIDVVAEAVDRGPLARSTQRPLVSPPSDRYDHAIGHW